jgi:hypothetical protein
MSADPLYKPIRFLHNLGVFCFVYFLLYNAFIVISYLAWAFGFNHILIFEDLDFISVAIFYFFTFIEFIVVHILIILIVFLNWIFIFWLLIIIFVPFIIIIPIPIIPFVFILPLKPLLLAIIPPFKTLTDLGTLPTLNRIFNRMFSEQMFTNFFNYFFYETMKDLKNYLADYINQVFNDVFGDQIGGFFNVQEDTVDNSQNMKNLEEVDNPEDVKTYNDYKNLHSVKSASEQIDYETQLCINMKQKFKLYNSEYLDEVSTDIDNSYSPYSECYAKAIKSYLKTNIK